MLEAFGELVRLVDPDIVTGYNILNFDSPYLINRAETLKARLFHEKRENFVLTDFDVLMLFRTVLTSTGGYQ